VSKRGIFSVVLVVVLVGLCLTAFLVATVNSDRQITIGSGPAGTVGNSTAIAMKDGLEQRGFHVDIVTTESTGNLIRLLADPQSPIDVTFLGETVKAQDYPTVNSLGTISRRGILFATTPGNHSITSLAQAKGGTVGIGPRDSMLESIAIEVLAEFGVTGDNTRLINLSETATRADIIASGAELVEFSSTKVSDSVRNMLIAGELRMLPIPEAKAVSGLVRSAEAVDVPTASINLNPPVPSEAITTVAHLITVVSDKTLSPAAAFAIAQELSAEFGPSSQLSETGEFPNFSDRQLPVNQAAAEYYSTGAIPWEYEHLPPLIADSFTRILILGTLILVFGSIYSMFLPEAYSLWSGLIKPRAEDRFLASIEVALADGRPLTLRQRQRLSAILEQQDAGRILRQRAEALRPELSDPIEDETPDEQPPVRE